MKEKQGPWKSCHTVLTKSLRHSQVPERKPLFLSVSEIPILFFFLIYCCDFGSQNHAASSVRLNKTSSAHCSVCQSPKTKSLSTPVYPHFAHLHLHPPLFPPAAFPKYPSSTSTSFWVQTTSPGHFWNYNSSNWNTHRWGSYQPVLFSVTRWTEMTRGAWEANTAWDPLPTIPAPLDVSLAIIHIQVHRGRALLRAPPHPTLGTGDFVVVDTFWIKAVFADWVCITNLNVTICVPWFHTLLLTPVSSFCLTERHDSL